LLLIHHGRYLGDWLYLTFQCNVVGAIYFGATLANAVFDAGIDQWLWYLFPLVFALGTFLTVAYYGLDHFNPENWRRKEEVIGTYPHVHICSHLEHAHALPLVLVFATCVDVPNGIAAPSTSDAVCTIAVYMAGYLSLIHLNQLLTGAWPYAVIDDVTRSGGALLYVVATPRSSGLCPVFEFRP
jgi:hypothetical protein